MKCFLIAAKRKRKLEIRLSSRQSAHGASCGGGVVLEADPTHCAELTPNFLRTPPLDPCPSLHNSAQPLTLHCAKGRQVFFTGCNCTAAFQGACYQWRSQMA